MIRISPIFPLSVSIIYDSGFQLLLNAYHAHNVQYVCALFGVYLCMPHSRERERYTNVLLNIVFICLFQWWWSHTSVLIIMPLRTEHTGTQRIVKYVLHSLYSGKVFCCCCCCCWCYSFHIESCGRGLPFIVICFNVQSCSIYPNTYVTSDLHFSFPVLFSYRMLPDSCIIHTDEND